MANIEIISAMKGGVLPGLQRLPDNGLQGVFRRSLIFNMCITLYKIRLFEFGSIITKNLFFFISAQNQFL